MTQAVGDVPSRRATRRRRKPPRVTVTGVLGELLLTAGVVVLLYVAWQMWVGDWIMSTASNDKGHHISEEWAKGPTPEPPPVIEDPDKPDAPPQYEPPVMTPPEDAAYFAQMRIPRFGADYNMEIHGGVTRENTLDNTWIGLYPQSAMPGQAGNFAMAAHRTTYGFPFNQIDKLRLNDPIVVETPEGWYTYRFRTLEYVTPDRVEVLLEVPELPNVQTGEKYITLTACSPLYSLAERIVAYGVFDSFQPRALGEPASLTEGAP